MTLGSKILGLTLIAFGLILLFGLASGSSGIPYSGPVAQAVFWQD